MKAKTKKIVILLVLGLIFPLILNNNFNLSNDFEHKVDIPRTSVTYHYIRIDELATTNTTYSGNWTWARAQPWCTTGDGTKEYPYIIEDVTIIYPPAIDCLTIRNSRKYFIVRNCTFKDIPFSTFAGIRLDNVTNGNIIDNIAYNNTYGIYLDHCYYNNISGNSVSKNSLGIYLYYCDNNTVSGNTANYNAHGIYLEESNNITVSGNTANDNSDSGIYSYFCDYNNITGNTANNNGDSGFYLDNCNFNTISRNTINNNQDGIFIYVGLNNTFIGNTIRNNYVRGVHIHEDSDYNEFTENIISNNTIGMNINGLNYNNLVYKNFFVNNGKHAFDRGTDNKWNSTTIGNFWDNHTSPDLSPQDGIVDTPYAFIGGTSGSTDYLPIAEDGAPRITVHSPSAGSNFGSAAPSYNLEVIDSAPVEMWYSFDGGGHNYTFTELTGTLNQSAWHVLPYGPVTITFYARDVSGNIAFKQVSVVKAEGLDPGMIAFIIIISVVCVVAVLSAAYFFLKKRKIPT